MAEITAKMVNELRAKTGQGMMECKKILVEANGDMDAAIEILRKKGVKASLAERAAGEGRIFGALSADKKTAALVEVNCNTDFTARSEPFLKLGAKAAEALAGQPGGDVAAAVQADITSVAQTTGENVRVGRTEALSSQAGRAALYTYAISGKIAVAMLFNGKVENVTDELVTDIGGHIAFAKPLALHRDHLPAETVAKERELAIEQAKTSGKPANIAEKIAESRLQSYFKEVALHDQDFANTAKFKGTVQQLLQQKGLTMEKFVRMEVGQ